MNGGSRVLVTGGLGYIGAALLRQFDNDGTDYISIDKRYPRTAAKTVSIDLCDRAATVALITEYKPDVLVHCGTHSAFAYRDRLIEAFREDAAAIAHVLEAMAPLRDSLLVCLS